MATPFIKRTISFLILLCTGFLFLTFSACKIGKSVTMVVDPDLAEFIRNLSNDPENVVLNVALEHAGKARVARNEPFIPLFATTFEKENPGVKLASIFTGTSDKTITPELSDSAIIGWITGKSEIALKLTVEVVTARLKKLVDNSSVTYDKDKQLIMVTFKGEKNFDEVSKSLFTIGDLQMLEAYSNADAFPILQRINDAMAARQPVVQEPVKEEVQPVKEDKNTAARDTNSLSGYVGKGAKPSAKSKEADEKMKAMMAKYPLYAMVSPNVLHDELAPGPTIGFVVGKDTARLRKGLSVPEVRSILPANTRIFFSHQGTSEGVFSMYLIKVVNEGLPVVDSRSITKCILTKNLSGKLPAIDMEMNPGGTMAWRQMTGRNIGKYIAVVFDGTVYSCPRVENEITSGKTQMAGCFTEEEAKTMANVLGTGKLPLRLWIDKSDISK